MFSLVRAFLGQPGSGKTYIMSAFALEWAIANPDKVVYATYDLKLPDVATVGRLWWKKEVPVAPVVLVDPPFDEGVPILDCRDALLLIDEAALTFDSRMYQATPIALLHKLMQVRKYGLEVWWSTQHMEYVDKRLRLITFDSYHCGSFAGMPLVSGFFCTVRQGVKGGWQRWRYVRRSAQRDNLYDTYEVVNRASYMNRKGDGGAARSARPVPASSSEKSG